VVANDVSITTKFFVQFLVRVFHLVEKVLHLLMLVLALLDLQGIFRSLKDEREVSAIANFKNYRT